MENQYIGLYRNNQVEILKLKNITTEIKKWTDGFNSMSNIAEERVSEIRRQVDSKYSNIKREKQNRKYRKEYELTVDTVQLYTDNWNSKRRK